MKFFTCKKQDWASKLELLVNKLKIIPVNNTILDGKVVILDKVDRSHFQILKNSLRTKSKNEINIISLIFLFTKTSIFRKHLY
nr:hypothetical protein [Coxiella-like endosymbiont]